MKRKITREMLLNLNFKDKLIVESFNGNKYIVYGIAEHSETGEELVVCKSIESIYNSFKAIPIKTFLAKVDKKRYSNVEQEYNFMLLEKIDQDNNLEKICNLINTELDKLIKVFKNNDEQLWELICIKEEIEDIKKEITNKFFNESTYKNYINLKYKELYKKINQNINNINAKNETDKNSIMFDFLSEVFPNIYDYTKNLIIKKDGEKIE